EYAKVKPGVKPPSVWFPHTLMGISTSDILVINNDKFGPFEGQLLVADQGHSKIMRVFQEKVDGVYQGVCFPFREGFGSGILRMEWGPDNSIFVGQTNRGWASTGKEPFALERLVYNDREPFEMKTIKATADGFDISFTQPVNRASAANPESYSINDFTYKYHRVYGSPVTDLQTRTIYKVELSQDGLSAKLFVEGLREGFINEIKAEGVKNTKGQRLVHNFGYYTLNQIPGGGKAHDHGEHMTHSGTTETVDLKSDKRVTEMPSSWFDGPDVTLTLTTAAGMKFAEEELRVKAGQKVKFVLDNPDDMMHNVAIVKPGKVGVVAELAINLGLQGQAKGYIPDSEDVLYHSNLLVPNSSDTFYFVAPSKPGNYEYVCTFPAHAATMRGILYVE
ncbi:MAG: plastocyanin/azurin family copper-binding protein, partial [Bacteroidota bacterium]